MDINNYLQKLLQTLISNYQLYAPKLIKVIVIFICGLVIIKIVKKYMFKIFRKSKIDPSLEIFLEGVIRAFLWILLIIILLSNIGVNVSGLVAGLGVAGIVIGFALKDTLGNLAAGVFILFHKPFEVNDWIKVGGMVGCVKKIGISACSLMAPDGTKITVPNSKIWGDTIENYSGNPIRKIFNLEVGISYSEDIGKAIKVIHDILKKDKRVLKDPAPQVVAKGFGDSSINIAVKPAVKKEDYWTVYFDLIKAIKEGFDKKGITIPFPQRDVWIKEQKKKR